MPLPGTPAPPRRAVLGAIAALGAAVAAPAAFAQPALPPPAVAPAPPRCVVPAKPGGGFDLSCELAALAWGAALPVAYHPGGIGALVYQEVLRGQRPPGAELIAFSSGTLLNLVQGRFGRPEPQRLRWIAALALDHGVIAVHRDAPWRDLGALMAELRRQPSALAFAAGGTIGSQDWFKAVLLARAAGVDHRTLRVLAFEGGGDALQALQGRHVQVLCGDAAEISLRMAAGAPVRVLAVLAPRRLDGPLAGVPTAREQGVDLVWPILRGLYADARRPEAEHAALAARLEAGRGAPAYAARLRALGPQAPPPGALAALVQDEWRRHEALARAFGLAIPAP